MDLGAQAAKHLLDAALLLLLHVLVEGAGVGDHFLQVDQIALLSLHYAAHWVIRASKVVREGDVVEGWSSNRLGLLLHRVATSLWHKTVPVVIVVELHSDCVALLLELFTVLIPGTSLSLLLLGLFDLLWVQSSILVRCL